MHMAVVSKVLPLVCLLLGRQAVMDKNYMSLFVIYIYIYIYIYKYNKKLRIFS